MSKSYGALCKEQRVLCKVDDVEKLCSVGELDDVASARLSHTVLWWRLKGNNKEILIKDLRKQQAWF